MDSGAMDSQDGVAVDPKLLEWFLGSLDDELNATGTTSTTSNSLEILRVAQAFAEQPPSPSLYPAPDLYTHLSAPQDHNEQAVDPLNGAPPVIAASRAIAPSNQEVMAADKGQAAPVPQVMPNQPAQLATSDQPSDTIQFVKPVVPKTSGLRTSTASFSISPSLRGMDTKSMTIFSRFCRLHKRELGHRLDQRRENPHAVRTGAIVIKFAKVRKYPEIEKLLLDSDGKVFMDELLREELIDQPKELRRSDSYVIGDNGLWMLNHSRLQALGNMLPADSSAQNE